MTDKKPKDYLMGETAYNAFYLEQPQIFFEDLAHHAQMRWVAVARRVAIFHDTYRHMKGGKRKFRGSEEQRAVWRAQKQRSLEKQAEKQAPKNSD
jgi:hypothetical protein